MSKYMWVQGRVGYFGRHVSQLLSLPSHRNDYIQSNSKDKNEIESAFVYDEQAHMTYLFVGIQNKLRLKNEK